MNITFNIFIDDRIFHFFKRIFTKRNLIICVIVIVTGITILVHAEFTKPYTFSSGNVISSSEMNNNFDVLFNAVNRICPIGSIIAWHKNIDTSPLSLPDGWIECNGGTISDIESPLNGKAIPDLNNKYQSYHSKGLFLRGSTTSGVFENDLMQGHYHNLRASQFDWELCWNGAGGSTASPWDLGSYGSGEKFYAKELLNNGTNGIPRTGSETRPANMSIVWIMRIK